MLCIPFSYIAIDLPTGVLRQINRRNSHPLAAIIRPHVVNTTCGSYLA